jgi:hypothetical protein
MQIARSGLVTIITKLIAASGIEGERPRIRLNRAYLVRPGLGAPMGSNRVRTRSEFWKHDTAKTGALLLDVLALERQLSSQLSRRPSDDLLKRWQNCRGILTRLITDYSLAIARYRTLVKASYTKRIRS